MLREDIEINIDTNTNKDNYYTIKLDKNNNLCVCIPSKQFKEHFIDDFKIYDFMETLKDSFISNTVTDNISNNSFALYYTLNDGYTVFKICTVNGKESLLEKMKQTKYEIYKGINEYISCAVKLYTDNHVELRI